MFDYQIQLAEKMGGEFNPRSRSLVAPNSISAAGQKAWSRNNIAIKHRSHKQ